MKASMAREWSLWNQLQQGYSKFTNDESALPVSLPVNSDEQPNDDDSFVSQDLPVDEKRQTTEAPVAAAPKSNRKQFSTLRKAAIALQLLLIVGCLGLLVSYFASSESGLSADLFKGMMPCHGNSHTQDAEFDLTEMNFGDISMQKKKTKDNATVPVPHEVYEIPVLPELDYGVPVYNQSLLNHTFGNCWGIPAIVKYHAPPSSINFTQVVLTLDTTVDGVQFDRLAHVFIDDMEIWRSSTAEPQGNLTHSFAQKDVSAYGHLFSKNTTLMVQLNNLLTPRLTGSFNVSLHAYYYNNTEDISLLPKKDSSLVGQAISAMRQIEHEERLTERSDDGDFTAEDFSDEVLPGTFDMFFNKSEAAEHVIPLIKPVAGRPPLVYFPDSDFKITVPKLNENTTKAKVMVYISANAEEEFWYTNLLETFKDRFKNHGHTFSGHGPCRVVNLYYGDKRIGSMNPFPVVYSGGLSPALWNPIVSTGAFDVRALEFDITPLLPALWLDDVKLSVEVSNCLDDDLKIGQKASGVGPNWISSANLAVWEDSSIVSATGELLTFENSTKVTGFGFEPPFSGLLNQIVAANYKNKFEGYLNYTLDDGTSFDFISQSYSKVKHTNIMIIKKFGDVQDVISVPTSKDSIALLDPITNMTLDKYNISRSFPIITNLGTKPVMGPETEYQINMTARANFKIKLNGTTTLEFHNIENGTSNYTLSPAGNHGNGTMEHNYTISTNETTYNRHALADNFTVIYDNVTITPTVAGALSLDDIEEEEDNLDRISEITPSEFITEYLQKLGIAIEKEIFEDDDGDLEFVEEELAAYQTFMDYTADMLNSEDVDMAEHLESLDDDHLARLFQPVLFDYRG